MDVPGYFAPYLFRDVLVRLNQLRNRSRYDDGSAILRIKVDDETIPCARPAPSRSAAEPGIKELTAGFERRSVDGDFGLCDSYIKEPHGELVRGAAELNRESEMEEQIMAIAGTVKSHPALTNKFYPLWMSQSLPVDHVEMLARNYHERVSNTPNRIALAFLHMSDTQARAETVENLYDEMGNGNPDKAHQLLLSRFFEILLSKLRGCPVRFDEIAAPILPSTRILVAESQKLFSSPSPPRVCGALLAQEWHAYPQLVYMYEGARNYMKVFEQEEFHDACEYFYLHIGATEKQHKIHAVSTAAKMCGTDEDIAALRGGFTEYLDLLAANWEEIYARITAD